MRDRDLVRLYWPVDLRPAFDALFDIDDAMAEVVASSTQPALGAIRLAWWREALERLDIHNAPPEPRLQAAVSELLPRGITGAALAGLEDGWTTLLEDVPDIERVAVRGEKIFFIASGLLGTSEPLLTAAGRLYAYEQVFRRGLFPGHWPMEEMHQLASHSFSKRLRPLTALAKLAVRDARRGGSFEREATPGRAAALMSHRLFGTVA